MSAVPLVPEFSFDDVRPLNDLLDRWRLPYSTGDLREIDARAQYVIVAARALMTQYTRLMSELELVQQQLASANTEIEHMGDYLTEPDDTHAVVMLAQLVQWEHNRVHAEPWSICRTETCRAAVEWL